LAIAYREVKVENHYFFIKTLHTMANRFVIALLFSTIMFSTQSFTFSPEFSKEALSTGITTSNPSPGTLVLSWDFGYSSFVYEYIIEDVVHRQVVSSGQTSQNGVTVTGLAAGRYKITVSNGISTIIIDDIVH